MAFTLKVLASQLLIALVAACAILGIKITQRPQFSVLDQTDATAVTSEPVFAVSGASSKVERRGLSVQNSQADPIASQDEARIVASSAIIPEDQIPYQHKHSVYKRAHKYGDLPTLRWDASPDSETWTNSLAICACMFGENTTDVREWILYNRWLGVDHIYLTENGPTPPASLVEELQEFIDDGFITFRVDPRPMFQQTIYVDCMTQQRHKHNWMAFIDLDEFIVLREKDQTLKEFLNDYKHEPALVMHWVIVGPSHQENRPEAGGVLRAYRECQTQPSPVVKSIVNTFFLANMAANPHTFEYRNNEPGVDEYKRPMPWRYPVPEACTDGTVAEPSKTLDCRPLPHVQKRPASVDKIALFHYITRSKEDFSRKVKRGGGGGKHRNWDHFNRIQEDASSTGGLCDEAFEAADECCKVENLVSPAGKRRAQKALSGSSSTKDEGDSSSTKQRDRKKQGSSTNRRLV